MSTIDNTLQKETIHDFVSAMKFNDKHKKCSLLKFRTVEYIITRKR